MNFYDVIVAGAGPAGLCAAVAAARQGARVALAERYGVVGGNLTAGYVGPILGMVGKGTMRDELVKLLGVPENDMIGETGLDYRSHPHTRTQQQHFFHSQLELAREYDLPVNVHSRKASADTLEILKQHHCRGIIHSYSGSIEMARLFIKEGYYISFGASVLFPNSHKPQQVIAQMPLDRLLIETDSPYQSPIRDHRHEPADIAAIYRAIAEIRNISVDQLCKAVEDNFDNVFR